MQRVMTFAVFGVAVSLALTALAGGRACVGVLSGTMPAAWSDAALGLAYVAAYFAAVLVAPVLVLVVAACRFRSSG